MSEEIERKRKEKYIALLMSKACEINKQFVFHFPYHQTKLNKTKYLSYFRFVKTQYSLMLEHKRQIHEKERKHCFYGKTGCKEKVKTGEKNDYSGKKFLLVGETLIYLEVGQGWRGGGCYTPASSIFFLEFFSRIFSSIHLLVLFRISKQFHIVSPLSEND